MRSGTLDAAEMKSPYILCESKATKFGNFYKFFVAVVNNCELKGKIRPVSECEESDAKVMGELEWKHPARSSHCN
jgi:hypothetical protein